MWRSSPHGWLLVALALWAGDGAMAENIDPVGDASQYAWCENTGWINAEPLGNGGVGLQIDDFELSGYMWGENIGWISLSCRNDSSCGTTDYGVVHDGDGVLSGYAWAENVGWINFSPVTDGVAIDVSTGEFGGRAWGENIGWVSFASAGANPFSMKTVWNCDPPPNVPPASPSLTVAGSSGDVLLTWTVLPGATGYDIVQGDLAALGSNPGGFASATVQCLDRGQTSNALAHAPNPSLGNGFWYAVRGANCGGRGTYDAAQPSQAAPRDLEIASSGNDCPSSRLIVFVTTAVMDGNLSGESGANLVCQNEADAADLPGNYRAMLSMSNVTPSDPGVPYYLPGGAQVAVDFADWFDGDGIVAVVDQQADASPASGTDRVWTGTTQAGSPSFDCLGWISSSSGDTGLAGSTGQFGSGWTNWGQVPCNAQRHLYCFQIN